MSAKARFLDRVDIEFAVCEPPDGVEPEDQIPPDQFGIEQRMFVDAIVRSAERLEPAVTPLHRAVYRVLSQLADKGIRVTGDALGLGILLAAAKLNGIPIEMPTSDLAKFARVRYETLLKVRRVAMKELGHLQKKPEPILRVEGQERFPPP